jgi:hypothetical protein
MCSLASDPGAVASLSVVAAGFALAVLLFHLMRLKPARELAAGKVSVAVVRAHLAESF